MEQQQEPPASSPDSLYRTLEAYPWHADREFQSGLHAILGPTAVDRDPSQTQDLTLRARCFYYARKQPSTAEQVDFDAYSAWRVRQPASALSSLAPSTLPPPDDSAPSSAETTPSKPGATRGLVNGTSGDGEQLQREQQRQQAAANSGGGGGGDDDQAQEPAYPPSFATIMELIKSGQPIPGIKSIPDTVLVGQASEATKDKRRKPWEERQSRVDSSNEDDGAAVASGGGYGGYFGGPGAGSGPAPSSLFASAENQQ